MSQPLHQIFFLKVRSLKFVLVHASAHKNRKNLNTQAATYQEIKSHQAEQNTTYQTDSLKEEKHKKLFAEADSLNDKICLVLVSSSQSCRICRSCRKL